jgi:phosphatidylinositol-3-phosphatase
MLQARFRVPVLVLATTVPLLLAGPLTTAQASPKAESITGPPAPGAIKHVVWIWEENHSYDRIIGSTKDPYINSLATTYGSASNAWGISHPSVPNYLGATSGLPLSQLPKSDCTNCTQSGPDLFTQGETWKSYLESMPTPCDRVATADGLYEPRHNPATYYLDVPADTCTADDVPYTALSSDLAHHTLPAFSYIAPNMNDDMHNGTIEEGDSWLSANLPALLDSTEFTSGSMVVFIMWDEGQGGGSLIGTDCTTSTSQSCHVPLLVLSAYTHGMSDPDKLTHYSVLRATEELLGLPDLGQAATAPDLLAGFGLAPGSTTPNPTSTTLTANEIVPSNTPGKVVFSGKVSATSGGTPTGTVALSVDGAPAVTLPMKSTGAYTYTHHYSVGAHTATAAYSGSTSDAPSTVTITFTVT